MCEVLKKKKELIAKLWCDRGAERLVFVDLDVGGMVVEEREGLE